MTKLREKLIQETRHLRLSSAEKTAMHKRFFGAHISHSQPSPYFNTFSTRFSFALFLLLVVGVGTGYASESALPGEILYPIKVQVMEKATEKLAFTPEAKAKWSAETLVTRIEEVETLTARGAWSADMEVQIEARIEDHVQKFTDARMAIEASDPEADTEIFTEVDSTLLAHSDILEDIGTQSSDEETRDFSWDIAKRIRATRNFDGLAFNAREASENIRTGEVEVPTSVADQDPTATSLTTEDSASSMMLVTTQEEPPPVEDTVGEVTITSKEPVSAAHRETPMESETLRTAAKDALQRADAALQRLEKVLQKDVRERTKQKLEELRERLNADESTSLSILREATRLRTFLEASYRLRKTNFAPAWHQNEPEEESEHSPFL